MHPDFSFKKILYAVTTLPNFVPDEQDTSIFQWEDLSVEDPGNPSEKPKNRNHIESKDKFDRI